MASSSSVSNTPGVRPFVQQQPAAQAAPGTRPGRDPQSGKPLGDKDVYEPTRTAAGERIDTSDGISEAEGAALAQLAVENSVDFLQKLSADSENGTEVRYHFEAPVERVGHAFADFTARDSNVLIECGVNISQDLVKDVLKDYLAPDEKQSKDPIVVKMTLTGKINERGEIGSIKAEASVANLPKLSGDKLAEFEKNIGRILEQLPVGQTVTEEMKAELAESLKRALKRTSTAGVEFFRGLIESSQVFKIDVAGEKGVSKAHLTGGKNALDIQVDHALDEVDEGYPRVDGHTKLTLDEADKDTLDLGKPRVYTTENLLVSVEGNKPALFRIEADGSRTPLKDVFGQIILGLPLVIALLAGKGIRF